MKKLVLILAIGISTFSSFSQKTGKCISGDCKNGEGKFLLNSGDTLYSKFKEGKASTYGEIHFANKNIYTGYLYRNMPNGNGKMHYSNGDIYQGFWQNGKRSISGSLILADGTKIYGDFNNDKLIGPSSLQTGCLVGNCIEGRGSYIYADGKKYNGNFWASLKHGNGNFDFGDGSMYMGHWELDTIQGYGTMRYANGDYYEGQFFKGKKSGYGTFVNTSTRTKKQGLWINDEFKKELIITDENKCLSGDCAQSKSKIKFGLSSNYPGATYEGEFSQGKPNGFGTLKTIDGQTISGFWQNSKFYKADTLNNKCNLGDCITGYGLYDWASGEYYLGFWQNDRRHYYGKNHFASGNEYKGFWNFDKKEGYGEHSYLNGEAYKGYFKKDWRNGIGEFVFTNGNRYVGEFRNDTIYGEGILYYPDGKIERGFWRGDKLIRLKDKGYGCISGDCWYGYGTYISKRGNRYIGEWLDSKYNGSGLLYETNGNIYVGDFKNGVKEGYGKQYWANGERYIGYWKNNQIDGRGTYVYRNDSLLNAFWRQGLFVVEIPKNPDIPKIIWEVPLSYQTVVYSNKFEIKYGIISATQLSNVQVYVNNKLTASFAQFDTLETPLVEFDYTLKKIIKLKEGDNIIKIIATNDYGKDVSTEKHIRYKPQALLKKQALLIANTYNNKHYEYYASNIIQLEKYLLAQNYEVVKLINPTRKKAEEIIRDFGQRLQANQTPSFVYFGGLMKQINSKNYFIFENDSLSTKDEVIALGVELTRLYAEIQYGGSNENHILLDYTIPEYQENLFKLNGEWGLFPSLPPLNTSVYFSTMPGMELSKKIDKNLFFTEFMKNLNLNTDFSTAFKQTKKYIETATNKHQMPFYLENNSRF